MLLLLVLLVVTLLLVTLLIISSSLVLALALASASSLSVRIQSSNRFRKPRYKNSCVVDRSGYERLDPSPPVSDTSIQEEEA